MLPCSDEAEKEAHTVFPRLYQQKDKHKVRRQMPDKNVVAQCLLGNECGCSRRDSQLMCGSFGYDRHGLRILLGVCTHSCGNNKNTRTRDSHSTNILQTRHAVTWSVVQLWPIANVPFVAMFFRRSDPFGVVNSVIKYLKGNFHSLGSVAIFSRRCEPVLT